MEMIKKPHVRKYILLSGIGLASVAGIGLILWYVAKKSCKNLPKECPPGESCLPPYVPGDCPSGEECRPPCQTGECPPGTDCRPPCQAKDCPSGEKCRPPCQTGECPPGTDCRPPCQTGECPPGTDCRPPCMINMNTNKLLSDQDLLKSLSEGNSLVVYNKDQSVKYKLTLESKGIVVYNVVNGTSLDITPADMPTGTHPYNLQMQGDGNLVLYDDDGKDLWSSNTAGKGDAPFIVILQNDGNFCIYDAKGNKPQWCSNKMP